MQSTNMRIQLGAAASDMPLPIRQRSGRAADRLSEDRRILARERAITYLVNQRQEERRAADGRCVGIQSHLATSPTGENAIDLYQIIDGMVVHPGAYEEVHCDDPTRALWQDIANWVQDRLGFPLEPELFSNMLHVAHAGLIDHPHVQRICRALLPTFGRSDAHGLYHFFTSLRFAGDIDCTAVAARARIVAGDFDLQTERGANDLRRITDRILRSASVCDVPAHENESHGKNNGPLRRHVFKVYLDDHEIHGAEYDRGLKINPVVVANGLFPVLYELTVGARDPHEVVPLKEFAPGSETARTGRATVAQIVAANVSHLTGFLLSGQWREGCRYYPSPDAFLCFYSELVREYPEVADMFGLRAELADAIDERRSARQSGVTDPHGTINLALRAIAAQNLGEDATPELTRLIDTQEPEGGWTSFSALYCLGTRSAPRVYFGSPAQTAGFAARALTPSVRRLTPEDPTKRHMWSDAVVKHLVSTIV